MQSFETTIDQCINPAMRMVISLPALSHTISHCLISLPARKQQQKEIPIFIFRRHCRFFCRPVKGSVRGAVDLVTNCSQKPLTELGSVRLLHNLCDFCKAASRPSSKRQSDPTCLSGFAQLINDIIGGNLPAESKQFILSCNLIAIQKANGMRPIAMGEIFYRLAAKSAKYLVTAQLAEILEPIQLGINTSGGCETAIHSITAELTNPDSKVAFFMIQNERQQCCELAKCLIPRDTNLRWNNPLS